jgi:hypothetical protein
MKSAEVIALLRKDGWLKLLNAAATSSSNIL